MRYILSSGKIDHTEVTDKAWFGVRVHENRMIWRGKQRGRGKNRGSGHKKVQMADTLDPPVTERNAAAICVEWSKRN